ncbi:UDP-N-acetylmuramate:L-alanyl-gamma-D-glutamyl-meso-diaminopimelate ligase [Kistimonas asteriae]|uniref:UDP-N-acetylmuramate:L-alanyl-gamma-D-glutamyl- meso-diaminopimelate ligase n=1 Tax=Kistimonas asteriae TaxID=517724 RepID=UPI001BA71672|nr:UDP-N-acetylmuramate:L-alanyl-gamma-D-glutamyl-meso-diaminopimelate ligase [Kistimonas asteriae]
MHVHILGICGTFMGSLALLARELGIHVTGSDQNVYPPMSTQLEEQGIALVEGYNPEQFNPRPDLVVIGNAMSRGNPAVEFVLNEGIPYTSGPRFMADHILRDRWVMAVAGTHGKTTTSAMLAVILEHAGMSPGFLIGGVPADFGLSARMGSTPFFVIEADEYDTAFFDKRSKFVHYRPRTAILNNLEFDHADIFENLGAIQKQFHHLVRTIPGNGLIIKPADDANLNAVIDMGCWSDVSNMGPDSDWQAIPIADDSSHFAISHCGTTQGEVCWSHTGRHNMHNALAAIIAARHVGVQPAIACEALSGFRGVKRRMELLAEIGGIYVYDDFAHHPTAIATTLEGLRAKVGTDTTIQAVIEPRSNTMKMGIHKGHLAAATATASHVTWYEPEGLGWSLSDEIAHSPVPANADADIDHIVATLASQAKPGDHLVIMSNGGFGGLHQKLISALNQKASA